MSFGDEAPEPQYTTRLAANYRLAIEGMRKRIDEHHSPDSQASLALHTTFDVLVYMIARGLPTQQRVPLEVAQAELDAERAAAGITALLDDSAPVTSSDRDSRDVAAE